MRRLLASATPSASGSATPRRADARRQRHHRRGAGVARGDEPAAPRRRRARRRSRRRASCARRRRSRAASSRRARVVPARHRARRRGARARAAARRIALPRRHHRRPRPRHPAGASASRSRPWATGGERRRRAGRSTAATSAPPRGPSCGRSSPGGTGSRYALPTGARSTPYRSRCAAAGEPGRCRFRRTLDRAAKRAYRGQSVACSLASGCRKRNRTQHEECHIDGRR